MSNLTLEEIAKQAGVSRSTVSRVVNDHPSVRPEVRERVLGIIEQTGYQPHAAAQSLASRRSNVIGFVIPRTVHTVFTDPYFPRLTQGIAQACNQHDCTLSLFLIDSHDAEEKIMSRITRRGFLDGIIVQSTFEEDTFLKRLQNNQVPYVVIGHPFDSPDASYIDIENMAGAHNAVTHLLHQGRKNIATITGPLNSKAGSNRLDGYKQALSERGVEIDENLIVEGDFTERGGYYAAKRLIKYKPDAVFIASDVMAMGALKVFQEAGLNVPTDIAIVGFDDLPPARLSSPQLTTIRQPIRRFGLKAVEVLLDIIENGVLPHRRVVFGTELIIRESCGATTN